MGMTPLDEPSQIKTSCDEEAAEIVNRISVRECHINNTAVS